MDAVSVVIPYSDERKRGGLGEMELDARPALFAHDLAKPRMHIVRSTVVAIRQVCKGRAGVQRILLQIAARYPLGRDGLQKRTINTFLAYAWNSYISQMVPKFDAIQSDIVQVAPGR